VSSTSRLLDSEERASHLKRGGGLKSRSTAWLHNSERSPFAVMRRLAWLDLNYGLGNQKDEKIKWSSGIGWFILKRKGKVLYFIFK
jgi:hypothetical protein